MGLNRVSEQRLEQMRDEVSRLKKDIAEKEAIAKEKDSPLWLRIGGGIKRAIDANREKLEELLARESTIIDKNGNMIAVNPVADLGAAKALAGAIKFGKLILQEVEVDEIIANKRERAALLTEEIKRIQEEQAI